MAEEIKSGSPTGQDALAVELLTGAHYADVNPEENDAGRVYEEAAAEHESSGGAENVYLSGLLGEFSSTGVRRPDGGTNPSDYGSLIGHADRASWTQEIARPEQTDDERPVEGFVLSDELAGEPHDRPVSTGERMSASQQESASTSDPARAVDITIDAAAGQDGSTYRSTSELSPGSQAAQPFAAPAEVGAGAGPANDRAAVVEGDVATLADASGADAIASTPVLGVSGAAGTEDAAIALDITGALGDKDGSETLSYTIEGVPAGAVLSAGIDNGDGSWTLTPAQLAGLTITPPPDSDADFTLTVTATSTESNGGDTASVSADIEVSVAAVADAPILTVSDAAGLEDTAILLDVAGALGDTDGSETLSYTIEGVPTGAVLSAGIDNGDGSWALTSADLAGLTLTPTADSDGDFTLTVTATSTEEDGGDTESVSAEIDVSVAAVADSPTLTVSDAAGLEDTAILLDVAGALGDTDGSETLSYTIEGVPAEALLSAGVDNGNGSWTLTPADLVGLTITPPADSDGDFVLTVTATSTEVDGGETASVSADLTVAVTGVADAPTLSATDASGLRDTTIALDITSQLGDLDGSESLSILVEGMPAGAILSAGTDNGDGSWTLTQGDLAGLELTPPQLSVADFDLTVTATSTEADGGDTSSVTTTMHIGLFDDVHHGTGSGDLFEGRGGDDQMFGYGGNDEIYGDMAPAGLIKGAGDGGWGHDELHGGAGNDKLYGGKGDDRLFGDEGNDRLYGEEGNDTFFLGAGNDQAWGGDGSDLIVFGAGDGNNNSFDGGDGDWSDLIRVDGVNGDPSGGDWTLTLTAGSVVTSGSDSFDLSADAAGTIRIADGSELTFVGVERIEW